ncbi:MAG: HlyD family secretion protein [Bacteroidetes bacterium]|nr:HlyD family secretion protein [Bacteroidota bacterium]
MQNQENTQEQQPKPKSKRFAIVLGILVVVGATFGITKYIHSMHHEETDDAQVDAYISPVIPRVSGYVNEIKVTDNQMVKKGDTLLVLDDRDLRIKLEQAEAALAAAQSGVSIAEATTTASQANVATTEANVSALEAQIEAAKVNVWRATQDFNRYSNLIKDKSITQQQFEQAQAAKQTAERQLQVIVEQKNAAIRQSKAAASQSNATSKQISVAEATIKQKQAEVDAAKLNLSYTVITAAQDGMVSKINIQPGQLVQAGQSLFNVVGDGSVWVIANFKETQLSKMKVGEKVTVSIDAFDGHEFEAKLVSLSPATGAKFTLLPPDNASGNFVKVVQRVPVKIAFTNPNDAMVKQLRPGMNAIVDVHLD